MRSPHPPLLLMLRGQIPDPRIEVDQELNQPVVFIQVREPVCRPHIGDHQIPARAEQLPEDLVQFGYGRPRRGHIVGHLRGDTPPLHVDQLAPRRHLMPVGQRVAAHRPVRGSIEVPDLIPPRRLHAERLEQRREADVRQ